MDAPCEWKQDAEDSWKTACKKMFIFTDGGIAENGFHYCPFCGGNIVIQNEPES